MTHHLQGVNQTDRVIFLEDGCLTMNDTLVTWLRTTSGIRTCMLWMRGYGEILINQKGASHDERRPFSDIEWLIRRR